jgi:hypothetical protein
MSGFIGHAVYAALAVERAELRGSDFAPLARRHWANFLAGSYLGCDIQTMPEAICADTGREVGYGTVSLDRSPITGGAVRPYRFRFGGETYTPRQIYDLFYGRSHLVFGWSAAERTWTLPWDHLAEYCTLVWHDAAELFGPSDRPRAYVLGWIAHVVSDALIKSVRPGVELHLLDGKYTPKNRPVQDLFAFHAIGRRELGLDWLALIDAIADTPVEVVQAHAMRVAPPRGRLAAAYPDPWLPQRRDLLLAVMAENRRYFRIWSRHEYDLLQLRETADGRECHEDLTRATGGLTYAEMMRAAEQAGLRRAIGQIAAAIVDVWEQVDRLHRWQANAGRG